jgi:hypothetical protein
VDFIKPDVTVYSEFGTSLAAPIVTGLVACMLQENPNLTSGQIKELLYKSGRLSFLPNNFVGYGLPDAKKIIDLMEGKSLEKKVLVNAKAKRSYKIKNISTETVLVFHKKDERNVILQSFEKPVNGKLELKRPENAKKSTVVLDNKLIEIFWKN